MKHRYLEVTFRRGKPLAAYLYLPRTSGAKAMRTVDVGHGLRVDYDDEGRAIGVEVTAPAAVTLEQLNRVLVELGQSPLPAEEWAPAKAA
jgi:uncharacterized protein YuzE